MDHYRRRGMWFGVMVAGVLYVLVSIAIAIMTVDTCGDESADKDWVQFPVPHWECSTNNFRLR